MTNEQQNVGKVYLVGAGPGDPGLLTLRGAQCLARADVVLYDYLVNPLLLEHASLAAKQVCLGQHGHTRIWKQDEINAEMVRLAKAGNTVVRLKGGDPAVFARGAEEVDFLRRHDVPFEIVPGITVALAAGSCAGIPVTHRDLASSVALITGQQRADGPGTDVDFEALARFPGTLVFYMGVTTAPTWTTQLLTAGKSPDTPVAIVRRCSLPDQQVTECTLGDVTDYLGPGGKVRPPAIVIIGEVTTLRPQLSWFDKRPLFGQTILVTRPADQIGSARACFAELGADVLAQPAIEISPPSDWKETDTAIRSLGSFQWIVFSSANGVRHFMDRVLDLGLDGRQLGGVRIATIGPGTARELQRYCLTTDLQPKEYRAEALAAALASCAQGQRFLLIRASRGREVLSQQLCAAGAEVEQTIVYQSSDVTEADDDISSAMSTKQIDWVTVTSSAIARSLVHLFGESLRDVRLASISPLTSAALRELGFEPAAEASQYTIEGVAQAIVKATE